MTSNEHERTTTSTMGRAQVPTSFANLQSVPMRPRGPRRHAAPMTAVPAAARPAISSGQSVGVLLSRRELRERERAAARRSNALEVNAVQVVVAAASRPAAQHEAVRPEEEALEWPTHPTRRELRLARAAGLDLPHGYTGKLAAWKAPAPKPAMSMAREFGPFPVYVPDLKDFRVNWALSLFLGPLGIDRFHRGHYVTGALKLLTLGGAGIWWAVDQIAVVTGRAVTRGNHPMTGRRSHRFLAGAASMAVIAGAGAASVAVAAPRAEEVKEAVVEAVAPEPLQPVWEPLDSLSGLPGETVTHPFTVTGDGVTFDYALKDAGFIYLVPAGTVEVTDDVEPMVSSLTATSGSIVKALPPGGYILIVKSPNEPWAVEVSQRVLR